MKQLVYTILILVLGLQAAAQPHKQSRERIHAIRIGFITERLQLSSKEAEGFWPVYNRYDKDFVALRKEYHKKYMESHGNMDRREAHKFIDEDLEYRERMLQLRKKYKNEFLKVIPATKLAELYKAEAEFKQMLIKRLEQRGKGRPAGSRRKTQN